MPRGGEYSDGPTTQSDNAIEAGENKIAGADVRSLLRILACLNLPPRSSTLPLEFAITKALGFAVTRY